MSIRVPAYALLMLITTAPILPVLTNMEPIPTKVNKDLARVGTVEETVTQSTNLSFFHAEGRDLVSDTTGQKTVFRGVNLNGLEFGIFSGNPYPGTEGVNYFRPRAEDFVDLATVGINVIRVPFEWARLVPGWSPPMPLPQALDPTYLGILDQVVQMASTRGIYVILDMHDFLKYWSGQSAQVCVDNSVSHQQLLSQTWRLLAAHFSNNPAVLGFDIQNEPVRRTASEPCGSCNWRTIAQAIVNSIRIVDQNHLIVVEGANFSLASDWAIENGNIPFVTDTITPSRVLYSPHVYFDFDNDAVYGETELSGPVGRWEYYMRDRLASAIQWSIDNNVPIFIGEVNVPCSANWIPVLEFAFRNFFDRLRLSVTLWHYIDPQRCSLQTPGCSLNMAACAQRHQLNVLSQHLGGTYDQTPSFKPIPGDSRLYDDVRVNPWDAGAGFFDDGANPGIEIDFSNTSPVVEGSRSISVHFTGNNFAALKLSHHHGIDTGRFIGLSFRILLTGNAQQNFKIFTTSPRSDCQRLEDPNGSDPVFPPSFAQQPDLRRYLLYATAGQWLRVEIPLDEIVDPNRPYINGLAFQNMGSVQDVFIIDDIRLSPGPADTAGLQNPSQGAFFLINSHSGGVADITFSFGPVAGWITLAGDWNGDGVCNVGLFKPTSSTFFLKNAHAGGSADLSFDFGPLNSGWIPIVGDWNADGVDTVGLFDPAGSRFFLKNSLSGGTADVTFAFGPAGVGWIPICGDWNGDGIDTIGLFNPSTNTFFLQNSFLGGAADITFAFGPAGAGWKPLAGDWNGDGVDTVGLFNPATSSFFLKNSLAGGPADLTFAFGPAGAGWSPLVGDWDGL